MSCSNHSVCCRDFVQKATLEKEQLLELAIDRHKKRAKALQEQLDETGVYIEDQNEQVGTQCRQGSSYIVSLASSLWHIKT